MEPPRNRFLPQTTAPIFGCMAAMLFLALSGFATIFVFAWAGTHCVPEPECRLATRASFAGELVLCLLAAAILGFVVYMITARIERRFSDMSIVASLINTSIMLLAVWLGFQFVMQVMHL